MYLQEPVSPDYPEQGTFISSDDVVGIKKDNDFIEIKRTITAKNTVENGRFIIDLGHIKGIIYIDDLKLVKKNN